MCVSEDWEKLDMLLLVTCTNLAICCQATKVHYAFPSTEVYPCVVSTWLHLCTCTHYYRNPWLHLYTCTHYYWNPKIPNNLYMYALEVLHFDIPTT